MADYEVITLLRTIAENTGEGELDDVKYEEVELYALICSNLSGTPAEGTDYEVIRLLEGIATATTP